MAVREGAAAEDDDQDGFGEGGEEGVVGGGEGFGEEAAGDRVAALEGEFGGREAGAELGVVSGETMVKW